MNNSDRVDSLIQIKTRPKNPVKENFFRSLVNKIGVKKILLIVFIIILTLLSILWYIFPKYSGLISNLIAEIFGAGLTIFIIDYLINYARKTRLDKTNSITNEEFLQILRSYMFVIMTVFDYIVHNDSEKMGKMISSDIAEKNFQKMLKSNRIKRRLRKIKSYSKENVSFLIYLGDSIDNYQNKIKNSLNLYKPFPDPELKRKLEYDINWISALFLMAHWLLLERFEIISRKENGPKGADVIAQEPIEQEKKHYEFSTMAINWNLNKAIDEYYKYCLLILELTKRAKNQSIPYSV